MEKERPPLHGHRRGLMNCDAFDQPMTRTGRQPTLISIHPTLVPKPVIQSCSNDISIHVEGDRTNAAATAGKALQPPEIQVLDFGSQRVRQDKFDAATCGPPKTVCGVRAKRPVDDGPAVGEARSRIGQNAVKGIAKAQAGAAEQHFEANLLSLQSGLAEAREKLKAARSAEALVAREALPEARAGLKSIMAEYAQGRGDLAAVLESQHWVHDLELKLLQIKVDEQVALAGIERLIGGGQ